MLGIVCIVLDVCQTTLLGGYKLVHQWAAEFWQRQAAACTYAAKRRHNLRGIASYKCSKCGALPIRAAQGRPEGTDINTQPAQYMAFGIPPTSIVSAAMTM